MNCHHFRATQKSIPDAQELIWLGGGIQCPPPSVKGLKEIFHHVTERTYFYVRQILFCLLVCFSLLLAILDHVGWCDHKLNLFEPIQCINGGDGIRVRMQQIYISENIIGCKD